MRLTGLFLFVPAFLAVLCVSCGQRQIQDVSTEISVKSGSGKIEDEWLEHIGVTVTVVPSNIPIAPIQSVDVVGDKCFVLDLFKRVLCVDMTRKQVILSKVSIGNADNEMLSPICLTADEEYVYVYDGMKGRILVLTHDLQYHHALNTGCRFDVFRKVEDGFTCLSMGQEQNFYFLGNDGIVTFSRKLSDIYPNDLSGECPMQIGADSVLYVKAYYSNTIYKW